MASHRHDQLLAQANAAFAAGDLECARLVCEQTLARNRRSPTALTLMGRILRAQHRFVEAETYLERSVRLWPDDVAAHVLLGAVQVARGKYKAAVRRFDHALHLQRDCTEAVHGKAEALARMGDHDRVRVLLAPTVESGREDATMAYAYAGALAAAGDADAAVSLIRRHVSAPQTGRRVRVLLRYRLGKLLEQAGEHDAAFDAYAAANRDQDAACDPDEYRRRVDELIGTFDAAHLPHYPRAEHGLDQPVLIVGMPRTGSTLVERIIDAHPQAVGAGETAALQDVANDLSLSLESPEPFPQCVRSMTTHEATEQGRTYVKRLRRASRAAPRIVDKRLANYELLGLAALLVPDARVVDCRRDPLDTCWACFTEPLPSPGHSYACDLANLGARYQQYERLMAHWRTVLPLRTFELRYEELVADPAEVSRHLIDFLGLPWDERCLRSHESKGPVLTLSREQVTKPVYGTSVGRSAPFAHRLEPLQRALAASGAEQGSPPALDSAPP